MGEHMRTSSDPEYRPGAQGQTLGLARFGELGRLFWVGSKNCRSWTSWEPVATREALKSTRGQ